jgi:peptidoglycan hydrolase-like protein with peptidoglycan-binding domain
MRRRTIAAFFSLACLLGATGISAASGRQSTTSSSATSSTSAHKKTKHKHSSKRQSPGQKVPTSDRISEIQSALTRGGYYQGDPTGKLDSNTVAALQKFQSANGLGASGKLDAPTLQKLGLGSDIAGVGAPKPVVPGCCSAPATSPPAQSTPALPSSPSNSQPQSPAGASANAASTAVAPDPKPSQK